MARRGRRPDGRLRNVRTFSFKLDSELSGEQDFRAFIEQEAEHNPEWNLRDYLTGLYKHHNGYVPDRSREVADAIVEATNGLWQVFLEVMQTQPATREDVQRIAKSKGVAFNDDFVDGMMGNFGKLED